MALHDFSSQKCLLLSAPHSCHSLGARVLKRAIAAPTSGLLHWLLPCLEILPHLAGVACSLREFTSCFPACHPPHLEHSLHGDGDVASVTCFNWADCLPPLYGRVFPPLGECFVSEIL